MARDHSDELSVVGLGTQDTFADAEAFRSEFDMSSTRLLWEDGCDSWQLLGVRAQPAGILLDADGNVIESWQGPVSPDDVLAALP